MNLANLIEATASRRPASPAVTHGATRWTYGEFARRVAGTAAALRSLSGMRAGDRIGIAMENGAGFLQVLCACWHAGLCPVPMNAKLHPREFGYCLRDCGARACFASPALQPGLRAEIAPDEPIVIIEADDPCIDRLAATAPMPPAERHADDPGWIFYTSGTTGQPKGATLTQRNLLFMTFAYFADIDQLDERDTIVHAAPLSHGSGLYALPHLARGSHQVIPASGRFGAGEVFELITRWQRVSLFAAPTMVVRMLDDGGVGHVRHDHLRTIMYGGGPMYVADLKRAIERFDARLFQIYGQGESPMTITGLPQHAHRVALEAGDDAMLASAGWPRFGIEVRIADDDGNTLEAGRPGEIVTRSDCVMAGYWNRPEANRSTLRDGWLFTGDVGSIDERGLLTIRDRSKDMIISGGSNIYPREIEDVLLEDPRVAQASVVGVAHPEWGEEVVAFVVATAGAPLDAETLDALCLARIARYKRPRRYLFVDDLPKNNYGKVLKTELRRRLANPG